MSFSDRLNEAMKNAGISQADLHRKTGFSRTAISKWCNGQTEPKDMLTLAGILRVTPEWLQFGKESRSIAPVVAALPSNDDLEDAQTAMMVEMFKYLTESQKADILRSIEEKKQQNEQLLAELLARKRA